MKSVIARLAGIAGQMRRPVAAVLSVVLAMPAQADTGSIKQAALGTQIGSIVEVRLTGKERPNKLRGRMGLLDNQAFGLVVESSSGEARSIPFDQVKWLRVVQNARVEPGESGATPEVAARAIPKGTLVEVRLATKQKPNWLRGRMGEPGSQEFQIQVIRSGAITMQTLRFDDATSIRPVDSLQVVSAPAKAGRVIGIGLTIALTAVVVFAIVLVVAAKTGHLGG
jgi:hypothetical protein